MATNYSIADRPINMLILLDRSASMSLNSVGEETYEMIIDEALTSVVTDPANSMIFFGLAAFPSEECILNAVTPEEQCYPADEMLVPIGAGNGEDIADALVTLETCGGTPLCDSLDFARETIDAL